MKKWNILSKAKNLQDTVIAMKARGFKVDVLNSRSEVLPLLKKMIPKGSEVMTGSSTTLDEVGVSDFLKSDQSKWKNLNAKVWSEPDAEKREKLRRESLTAEYYLASVNAIAQTGELIAVDLTGSRVGAFPFAAEHLILVVGTQKIVSNLNNAMKRIREHVLPLEDERAQAAYGSGSSFGKWVIIEKEMNPNRITVVLVNEVLGF